MWKSIVVVICLGYFSIEDLRKKEITGILLVMAGILGIVLSMLEGQYQDWHLIFRFVPGLICLGLGWLTREGIGYGDGLMILCLGCFLNLPQLLSTCFLALALAGVAALILLFALHKGKKTKIPFIPFLLAGYAFTLLG